MARYSLRHLIWYFGIPYDLANALGLRVSDLAGFGDELPKKYHKRIDEIMEGDALEEIKK